jgi:spore maturation protein CgeB
MPAQSESGKPRNIMLVIMGQSPYNRSIWTGFLEGFRMLGHSVEVVDATRIPDPDTLELKPDLLFAVHGFNVPTVKIRAYRSAGVTTAVYLLDEPYEIDRSVEWSVHYDYVFSVDKATVPVHRALTKAFYLPLAYNHTVFKPNGPGIPSRILVLGTPFEAREKYLAAVRDHWGKLVTWVGPGWKKFSRSGQHHEALVDPEGCARFYRSADIVINIHRDSLWSHFGELNKDRIEATHLNPRFWEVAGCRTFQLCSYRRDIDTLAPPAITFTTVDSLVQKIDYFIDRQKARKDFAKRVYNKIKHQTYEKRSQTVLETVYGTEL